MIRSLEAFALDFEGPVMAVAAQHLEALLSASMGRPCRIDLRLRDTADGIGSDGAAVILSPLRYLCDDRPHDDIGAIIAAQLAALSEVGCAVVAISTIFALADRREPVLIRRIRALNLLVLRLSQRTGVFIADVDRELSLLGGRGLGTDYRIESPAAREHAGRTIGTALFEAGRGTRGHL